MIATRLSEVGAFDVLLLEAGGEETDFTGIPGMHQYLNTLPYNWNFNTTPQTTSCLGKCICICKKKNCILKKLRNKKPTIFVAKYSFAC